jgi:hypothetical protein
MFAMLDNGYFVIRRSNYLYRDGLKDVEAELRIGDGDIVARIDPAAWKDIEAAREIFDWVNDQLDRLADLRDIPRRD